MWKQYGKDVETICEGCGNNMNWKQYDQNFHEPYTLVYSAEVKVLFSRPRYIGFQ